MSDSIESLPKGGLRDEPDNRDLFVGLVAAFAGPADWNRGSGQPRPPVSNQGNSDSCGGHAGSKLHWLLKRKNFSARDLFAPVALIYGSYGRDIMMRLVNVGQATQDEVPDPVRQTPQNMRDMSGISDANSGSDRELKAFTVPSDMLSVAAAIESYGGVFLLIEGTNEGWHDLTNPQPPGPTGVLWGHFLCAFDFHMHDGKRCIITGTSWGGAGVTEHHLKENYFNSGSVPSAWVLIPKEKLPMIRRFKVDDHGTLGVALIVDGSFDFTVYRAKNEEHYNSLLKFYEVPSDAPTIHVP